MLSEHLVRYNTARGWEARRVYLSPDEFYGVCNELWWGSPIFFGKVVLFDGAVIRKVGSYDVARKIKEWDLQ